MVKSSHSFCNLQYDVRFSAMTDSSPDQKPFFFYISKFCLSKICALKKVSNIEKKWKHKACQIKPSKKLNTLLCVHIATTYCTEMMTVMVRCPIFPEKNHEWMPLLLLFYKHSKIPNLGYLACKYKLLASKMLLINT